MLGSWSYVVEYDSLCKVCLIHVECMRLLCLLHSTSHTCTWAMARQRLGISACRQATNAEFGQPQLIPFDEKLQLITDISMTVNNTGCNISQPCHVFEIVVTNKESDDFQVATGKQTSAVGLDQRYCYCR